MLIGPVTPMCILDPIDQYLLQCQLQRGEYVVLCIGGVFVEFNRVVVKNECCALWW